MHNQPRINVIIYQEGDVWIAQGIELDIAARASSPDAAPAAFSKAMANTLRVSRQLHGVDFAGIGEAPVMFKEMFQHATSRIIPVVPIAANSTSANVDIRLATAS